MYHGNPQQQQQNYNFQMGIQNALPPSPVSSILLSSPSSSYDDHCEPIIRNNQRQRMSQPHSLSLGITQQ